jgi:hypothetical protein
MYAVTSSMNMNESAVNMHMVLIIYMQVFMVERIRRCTQPATRDRSRRSSFFKVVLLFFFIFLGTPGVWGRG